MAASGPFPSVVGLGESVANIDQTIDYVALRRDIARAVSRLCPNWMADKRDDLVQAALLRVMHIVERRPPGEGRSACFGTLPTNSRHRSMPKANCWHART
jgi:hypothetical protein